MASIDLGDNIVLVTHDQWRTERHAPKYGTLSLRPMPFGADPKARAETAIRDLFVHQSSGATLGADVTEVWLRNLFESHVFGMRYGDIAYNAAIRSDPTSVEDGTIFECRPIEFAPAATRGYNMNAYAVVVLARNGVLTDPAKLALRKLHGLVTIASGRTPVIRDHASVVQTHCGNLFRGPDGYNFLRDEMATPAPFAGYETPGSRRVATHIDSPEERAAFDKWAQAKFAQDNLRYPGFELKDGVRDPYVGLWQVQLTAAGFDPGPVDTLYGSRTEAATRAFQEARGLEVDGVVGPRTWAAAF